MAKQNKDSFLLRHDFFPQIKMLSIEQRGYLLTSIYAYATGEELPEMDAMTTMCFGFIKASMDANAAKYEGLCEQNRESGRLGGRPKRENRTVIIETDANDKKPNGFENNRTVFNETDRFSEKTDEKTRKPDVKHENPIESDSDSELESDSVSDSESDARCDRAEKQRERIFNFFLFEKNLRSASVETQRFMDVYVDRIADWTREQLEAKLRLWEIKGEVKRIVAPPEFWEMWRTAYTHSVERKIIGDYTAFAEINGVEYLAHDRVFRIHPTPRLSQFIRGCHDFQQLWRSGTITTGLRIV